MLRNAGDDIEARAPLINTSTHRRFRSVPGGRRTNSHVPPPHDGAEEYLAADAAACHLDAVPLRGDNAGP